MPPRRHWTINGDFLGLAPNGVARYAREVATALDGLIDGGVAEAERLEVTLVTPRPDAAPAFRRIRVRHAPEFRAPRLPQFWVQMQLPGHVQGGLLSFCNLAPLRVRRQIVCMHDAHTWLMPESYGRMFRTVHQVLMPMLGRRAEAVVTVSHHAGRQLAELGVAPRARLHVAPNGSDHALRWRPEEARHAYAGRRPYVLCIGRDQPYKNMEFIWNMAPGLAEAGVDILVAGEAAGPETATRAPNVTPLGRISDDELAAALDHALCFIFPSRMEGFGLPAAEAMARGCPVIASTADALVEICDGAAIHVDPDDPGAGVEAVLRLLREPAECERMRAAGVERAHLYTWRNSALVWLRLMQRSDAAAGLA